MRSSATAFLVFSISISATLFAFAYITAKTPQVKKGIEHLVNPQAKPFSYDFGNTVRSR